MATTSLPAMPKARQRLVGLLLFRLAETPSQTGDYSTDDDTGRTVQHILIGDFHLSYWADHAVRELRIVEIDEI